jgi:hypothetical protein
MAGIILSPLNKAIGQKNKGQKIIVFCPLSFCPALLISENKRDSKTMLSQRENN